MTRLLSRLAVLSVFALSTAGGSVRAGGTPSVEDLFGPGFIHYATLSPDGRKVAGTACWEDDIHGLFVHDLETRETTGIRGTERLDVYRIYWQDNNRLLFNVSQDKRYSLGLYSAPIDRLSRYIPIRLFDVMDMIGIPRNRPNRALVWIRQSALEDGERGPFVEINTLRSINNWNRRPDGTERMPSPGELASSVTRGYPEPKDEVTDYVANLDGDPAFAYLSGGGRGTYVVWDEAAETWRLPPAGLEKELPLAADPEAGFAWIAPRDAARGSTLRRLDLRTGAQTEPILAETAWDLRAADLVFSRRSRALAGVQYHRQRLTNLWFAPVFAGLQRALEASLPTEEDHRIVDFDDAENRFLIKSTGPRQPGLFRVYDLKSKHLHEIGSAAPALADKTLRPTTAIAFTARDGLALGGYLTTPASLSAGQPVPLVVLVHGGPRVRDEWSFDPEAQFLASLGYAVLQPNYRGSSGYLWPEGTDDYASAFLAMRDDVIDATRSALKSKNFDPRRVAIMGGSFGGYLALATTVEEPDLYRCAISVCGVFDWAEHVKSKREESRSRPGEYAWLLSRLGDPRKDAAAYEAINPLARLDRMRTPLLLAHGKEDRIVSVNQSRRLARELKKRGVPHETFYRALAGHGFYAAKDRYAFYQASARFLAENLASPGAVTQP